MENPYVASEQAAESSWGNPTEAKVYGGIRRLPFVLVIFGFQLVQVVLAWIFVNVLTELTYEAVVLFNVVATGVQLVGVIVASMLRIKNMGFNFAWGLTILVPLYNLLVILRLLSCQEGYADTRKLDRAGNVIAAIFLLLLISWVVFLVVVGVRGPAR